jgi:hypothetical protein
MQELESLEVLIDQKSLAAVLDELVIICRARANGDDDKDAVWSVAAGKLERLAHTITRLGI